MEDDGMDDAAAAVTEGLNRLSDWHGYNDPTVCGPGRGPECLGYWFKPSAIAAVAVTAVASDPQSRAEVAQHLTDEELWSEVERRHLVKQLGKCRCGRVFDPPVYSRRVR